MKQFTYSCDGGSLRIGNGLCWVNLPNNIGDGGYNVFVLDEGEKIPQTGKSAMRSEGDYLVFVGTCDGETEIYAYDCDYYGGRTCKLEGRYGIYCEKDGGDFFFEKWDD